MLYANNEMRAYLIDFAKNKTPVQKGYPNFLGGSNLGGNLGDNNEK